MVISSDHDHCCLPATHLDGIEINRITVNPGLSVMLGQGVILGVLMYAPEKVYTEAAWSESRLRD